MVSIIILTFNNLRYSKQCVESLFIHTKFEDFELILVDNGSIDGTIEWIKEISKEHANIKYHINSQNMNFSFGCNQGSKIAQGEYLLFLNNDTILTPGWLQPMLDCFSQDPMIGVVGNKHLFPNSDMIFHCGGVVSNDKVLKHIYMGYNSKSSFANVDREYLYVTGACLITKKYIFNKIGGFDNEFINSCEDVDLCLKIKELGYKILYCSKSYIYHYGSISEGRFLSEGKNVKRLFDRWNDRLAPDEEKYFVSDNFPNCLSIENNADIFIYSIKKELSNTKKSLSEAIDIMQSPKKILKALIFHKLRKVIKTMRIKKCYLEKYVSENIRILYEKFKHL